MGPSDRGCRRCTRRGSLCFMRPSSHQRTGCRRSNGAARLGQRWVALRDGRMVRLEARRRLNVRWQHDPGVLSARLEAEWRVNRRSSDGRLSSVVRSRSQAVKRRTIELGCERCHTSRDIWRGRYGAFLHSVTSAMPRLVYGAPFASCMGSFNFEPDYQPHGFRHQPLERSVMQIHIYSVDAH